MPNACHVYDDVYYGVYKERSSFKCLRTNQLVGEGE